MKHRASLDTVVIGRLAAIIYYQSDPEWVKAYTHAAKEIIEALYEDETEASLEWQLFQRRIDLHNRRKKAGEI